LYAALGQKYPGHIPSTAEFLGTKVFGKFTPLDINGIIALMRAHPDMYVVTDTKYKDLPNVRKEFGALVRAMGPDASSLSKRFIVQTYDEPMYTYVMSVYRFPNVLYTTYWLDTRPATLTRAVQFARAHGIRVVTFDMFHYSKKLMSQARAFGIAPAINTIDSAPQAAELNAEGARFIYSDTLPNRPWWATLGTTALVPAPLAHDAVPFNPHDD
jgi:hypothetical protein